MNVALLKETDLSLDNPQIRADATSDRTIAREERPEHRRRQRFQVTSTMVGNTESEAICRRPAQKGQRMVSSHTDAISRASNAYGSDVM